MKSLQGKPAVVTGAASGIGFQLTKRLLAEGAKVVMADVEPDALAAAAKEAGAIGEVVSVEVDVRDAASVDALADRATEAFGVTQLVFPNAGVAVSGAIWETTTDDWNWVMGVNLWGVINTMRAFVPRLVDSGLDGHVCFTSSLAGYMAQPGFGAYNTTKHGVAAIAETLAGDLLEAGLPIGVTVLAPWFVNTKLGQSARNRPADLSNAAKPGELMASISKKLGGVKDSTQEPEYIAELAIEAVKANQFAVFPFEPSIDSVRQRFETLLAGGVMGFHLP